MFLPDTVRCIQKLLVRNNTKKDMECIEKSQLRNNNPEDTHNNFQRITQLVYNNPQEWKYSYHFDIHVHRRKYLQYNTIQYNTIQYNTMQHDTIQHNAIQRNTKQHNILNLDKLMLHNTNRLNITLLL